MPHGLGNRLSFEFSPSIRFIPRPAERIEKKCEKLRLVTTRNEEKEILLSFSDSPCFRIYELPVHDEDKMNCHGQLRSGSLDFVNHC